MDPIPIRPDGLQLDEDRRFQERSWTAERIAWVCFALIVAGALLGATGSGGPLSQATGKIGESRVEYPTIARWATTDVLKVNLAGQDSGTVTFGPTFVDAFEIVTIRPDPSTSIAASDGLRVEFTVEGPSPAPVTFVIRPLSVGRIGYDISVGSQSGRFNTYVMP